MNSQAQRGFSLPEVLVATAIAAGVLAAAAQSISGSTRLTARASHMALEQSEAETIVARLRAGLANEQALQGFDAWRIEREALKGERGAAPPFETVRVSRETFIVDLLLLKTEAPL